ncbi:MAG: carbohydrate-binding domain-containing protein [Clostridia bacterium]|nr:carbohydrate-binding domain-containing protein [Clostridia bacterium]
MNRKHRITAAVLSAALTVCMLAGCGKTAVRQTTAPDVQAGYSAQDTEPAASPEQESASAGEPAGETTRAAEDKSGADTNAGSVFTSRDKETGYNADDAVYISLSDNGSTASGAGVTVSGNTVTVTAAGSYVISGALPEGQLKVDAAKTDKVQLVLNNMSISNSSTAPLYVKTADKVFVTLAAGSENTLTNTGSFTAIDENNIDACVFSKEDITFNGGGTLTVTSEQGHGIVSKDSLVITGGTYTVNAGSHGLTGKDDISILNCTMNVTCGEDGLHSENDDNEDLGIIYIEGGSITVAAGDDGIHAGNSVTINGGVINITKSYEGIEGQEVNVNGGTVTVRASDDGINAAGGADQSGFGGFGGNDRFNGSANAAINITGGTITVNADGDGVDSNGTLNVSGGTLLISGPTNGGNGALDYETSGTITGGTVVAAGSAGMAENFGSDSTQCSMLVSLSGSGGDTVTVTDASGNVLVSFTPEKAYQTVALSCPAFVLGGTYTVSGGNGSESVTFDSVIYGSGMGGFGGMGGPGGPGGGMGGPGGGNGFGGFGW